MKKKTKDTSLRKRTKDLSFEGKKRPTDRKPDNRLKVIKDPYLPVAFPTDRVPMDRQKAVIMPYSPVGSAMSLRTSGGGMSPAMPGDRKTKGKRKGTKDTASAAALADRKRKGGRKDANKPSSAATLEERKHKGRRKEVKGTASAEVLADRKLKSRRRDAWETLPTGVSEDQKPKLRLKAGSCDFIYAAVVAALLIFGVVMVFSASSYTALKEYGDSMYFFKRECVFALIGVVFMIMAIFVPIKLVSNAIISTPFSAILSFQHLTLPF